MANVAKVLGYIPSGFSDKDKQTFIKGIKEALLQAFGVKYGDSRVMLTCCTPENTCKDFLNKMATNLYVPEGHSDDEKEQFAIWYKKACDETFGEDARPAFVTIDEHPLNNEYLRGNLLSRA